MIATSTAFLDTAISIGARLCRDAIWDGPRCNWLGSSMEPLEGRWSVVHRSFGYDLYGGTSGIALFLGRLHGLSGEAIFRRTAEGAIRQALSRSADIPPAGRIAYYSGLTGIAYVLIELGREFADEQPAQRGLRILRDLAEADLGPQGIDVIGGYAGAIPALLSVHDRYRQDFLLDLAVRSGQALLETARKQDIGWSWDTMPGGVVRDLTGFGHGVAGVSCALLELFHACGETRFREAAEEGFRYERHWFNPTNENWPDFRDPVMMGSAAGGDQPSYGLAWCHGAPGIGLSRLRAFQLLGDPIYRAEAEAALRSTLQTLTLEYAGWTNYCACHGLSGNAELCLLAAQVLENPEYRVAAEQVGLRGITRYEQPRLPWPCGVMGGGENPSLMLGVAGIGYFYLRLHDPLAVPPVLILLPGTRAVDPSA